MVTAINSSLPAAYFGNRLRSNRRVFRASPATAPKVREARAAFRIDSRAQYPYASARQTTLGETECGCVGASSRQLWCSLSLRAVVAVAGDTTPGTVRGVGRVGRPPPPTSARQPP